jgi:hypothetical protein
MEIHCLVIIFLKEEIGLNLKMNLAQKTINVLLKIKHKYNLFVYLI